MSLSWQMCGSLNSENHKAMPYLHEFSSGQQPCMEFLINQYDYDAMHLSPLPSYVSSPCDSCSELSIFHQQASSPSLVEQHPNGHSNSPLSQPFMPEHQEPFMRTKMPGLLPTEALAYQPKTHAHARDPMQAHPEFPGDITFDDFHSPTDAFLTNFVEEENLQKETDQMNQPITDPNVTIHEQGTSAVSQEAQVNPIGLENYSTGKALSDPIEDQSDTSGAEFACKTRMRWTPEVHECFVQAVEQLGGPDRATPKNILSKMGVDKLTMGQVKSHLQKYRERNLPKTREDKRPFCSEGKKRHTLEKDSGTPKLSKKESETLHKQWELQKTLHHQLNDIRAVQLQAEEHGRRLQEFIKDHNRLSEALKRITQPMPTTSTTTSEEASIQRSDSADLLVGPTMHHPMREEAHSRHVQADALTVEPEVDLGLQSLKRPRLEKKSTSVASP